MGQGKYGFDQVPMAPGPREHLRDGLPVGQLRVNMAIRTKQFCECENPELRDESVRVFQFIEGRGVVQLKSCKACGLPIR